MTALSPIMDAISVEMKNKRQNVVGSLKTNIPTNTVPTAPIPVQTAYAVPMGSDCVALNNSVMLMANATKNPAYQSHISFPVVFFALPRQKAKATSNSPAMMRIIQFILEIE